MALIKCSECGKKVSDTTDTCIHCGSPLKETTSSAEVKEVKSSWGTTELITGLIVFVVCIVVVAGLVILFK